MNYPKKICPFCGCSFESTKYKKSIQYCCAKVTCQRERHSVNCKEWRKENPDYDSKKKPRKRKSRAAYFKAYRANNPDYVKNDNKRRRLDYHRSKSSATQDSDIKITSTQNSVTKNYNGKHREIPINQPTKIPSIQNMPLEITDGGNIYSFIRNYSATQNSGSR